MEKNYEKVEESRAEINGVGESGSKRGGRR